MLKLCGGHGHLGPPPGYAYAPDSDYLTQDKNLTANLTSSSDSLKVHISTNRQINTLVGIACGRYN